MLLMKSFDSSLVIQINVLNGMDMEKVDFMKFNESALTDLFKMLEYKSQC